MTLEMELKKQFKDGEKIGYDRGLTDGLAKGFSDGLAEAETEDINILKLLLAGNSINEISEKMNIPIEKVQKFYDTINRKKQ